MAGSRDVGLDVAIYSGIDVTQNLVPSHHPPHGTNPHYSMTKGLSFDAYFCPVNKKPIDTVEWEVSDAVIKNSNGDIIFEQRQVFFPVSWSQAIRNVFASAYFYGDLAYIGRRVRDGGRETELAQLIERVVGDITLWGQEKGCFASATDAETFYHELYWLCLHQYVTFRASVWKHVGLGYAYGMNEDRPATEAGVAEEYPELSSTMRSHEWHPDIPLDGTLVSLDLNTLKKPDGTFDTERFEKATLIIETAREILLDMRGMA